MSHDRDPHSVRQQAEQKVIREPFQVNAMEIIVCGMRSARVLGGRCNLRHELTPELVAQPGRDTVVPF